MTGLATMRRTSKLAVAALALTAGLLLPTLAVAQAYPSRVVKIIVPFPAGGPLDATARLLADKLARSTKQPFVVENRPGGAGNLGTDAVAKAAADGYTLLLVLDTPLTVNPWLYTKLPFDPVRDFTPISTVASFSLSLVVHPSVPVNSVAEFVAYAKTRKEKPLLYGSGGGPGNPGHLAMEYFRLQAGFDAVHVPYKGNAEVVMGLVSGQIEAGFLATPGVLPSVRDGRLKALAVSSPRRTSIAPDVPTVAESGYSGFEVGFYQLMLAPAGIPESVRSMLERELQDIMQSAELQERLRVQALEPIASTSAETDALLKRVSAQWQTVIRTADIRIE
ncbi:MULTISPECIES: Bug family tripartite tricarboxylate transporter substrate binding protein [unclassified Bradyrhizobium]|uniref:Bug family tripartite tricarboxylate transporter substrate binding protein n=1 Tax=unclassified Bradyrhizobium TaxID=2631580 RepID=UPI002FF40F08